VVVRDYTIEVGVGASFAMQLVNSGGKLGRVALDVTLYEGASFALDAALIGGEGQTVELVTRLRHFEANATSRQTVRGIAGPRSTISYLGKIAVSRDAQKTDAVQSVKSMLLDRSATVNAKPKLEIYADDVKCAHGATVGELDAQALFYLASRGLPPAEAKSLLLRAFVSGLFDGSGDEAKFTAAIDAALERLL
jgi:Fe-S cluster assembly protein SufD